MRLQLSSWPEVETYLKSSNGIIIPIGSTEQHGPTGFVGTDAICPETIAKGVMAETGAMTAPTLSIGMAQHHMAFTGTITFRPTTLIAVVRDVVESLHRHGFERFFFLNGHGGNIATCDAAFSEIYADFSLRVSGADRPPPRCTMVNWFDGPDIMALSKELYGDADGAHATAAEVSLTYYAYPEDGARVARNSKLDPEIAPWGPIRDADDYRRRFPDGRIGSDPTLSSVADGKRLYDTAVAEVSRRYRAFMEED